MSKKPDLDVLVNTVYGLESSWGADPKARVPNQKGALGPFQITKIAFDDVVARYPDKYKGVKFENVNLYGVGREIAKDVLRIAADRLPKYNVPVNSSTLLGAYNAGAKGYAETVRSGKLPMETQAYLQKAQQLLKQESEFKTWFDSKNKLPNHDPYDPRHAYDYKAAWQAGVEPNKENHWPSTFKKEGHPNLIVNGINTKTGQPFDPQKDKFQPPPKEVVAGVMDQYTPPDSDFLDEPISGSPTDADFVESESVNANPKREFQLRKSSPLAGAAGGVGSLIGSAKDPQRALPAALQLLGSIVGARMFGRPGEMAGGTIGAATGEAGAQGIEKLVYGDKFQPDKIRNAALMTGLTEMAGGAASKLILGKEPTRRGLAILTKRAEEIKGAVRANNYRLDLRPIADYMQKNMSQLRRTFEPPGHAGQIDEAVANLYKTYSQKGHHTVDDLMRLEQQLQATAEYPGQVMQQTGKPIDIQDKGFNKFLLDAQGRVSQAFDRIAERAGYPEYKQIAKAQSKALRSLQNPSVIGTAAKRLGAYAAGHGIGQASGMTHPFVAGAGGMVAESILENPQVQKLLYDLIETSKVGRAATLGASETLRRSS